MEPEIIFQRYAFPCAFNLHNSGKLTKKEYERLMHAALDGKPLPRNFLEEKFSTAIQRIRKFTHNEEIWNEKLIRNYFRYGHNRFVEEESSPENFKNLCKVHEAEIIDFEDNKLVVKYNKSTRKVNGSFVPDAKKGDRVLIHWHYAVEKI